MNTYLRRTLRVSWCAAWLTVSAGAAVTNYPQVTDCAGGLATNGTLSTISAVGQSGGYTRATNGTLIHCAGFLGAPYPTPKPQTVTFPVIADQLSTNSVGLAATASSGLTVSFAVASGSASISGGTNLTFSGAGTVSIIASQTGNYAWKIAPDETNTFNVSKTEASVVLSDTNNVFDGSQQSPTITTVPGGLTTSATYDGGTVVPSNAGVYTVVATINDAMYHGSTTGTMTIARAIDTISFSATNQVYNGTRRQVAASTANTQPVVLSYDGNTMAPSNTGVYSVTGVVDTANWAATNTTELTITKAPQTISFSTIAAQETTNVLGLAATADSGLPVTFSVTSGPAAIAGGTNLSFSTAGSVSVVAAQGGDSNWQPASDETNTFSVTKSVASVTLTGLGKVYNGAEQTAGSTTVPGGLTVNLTYDGLSAGPTNAGAYQVIGLVNDLMYQGGATNNMIIERAIDTITFGSTNQIFNGSSRYVTSNSANSQPIEITYDGSTTAPSNTGTYAVTGVVNSANWAGTNTTELNIGKSDQTITFPAVADQDVTNTVGLEATSDSGLTVSFAVLSGPGNLAAGTNLTFDATGTVLITADQIGDANYNAAPTVTNAIIVNPALAAIASPSFSNVYETVAALGADITATNHVSATERGVFWGTSNNFDIVTATRVSALGSFGEGPYSVVVSNLPAGATNYFRGFVVNAAGTNMTTVCAFLTRPAAPEPLVVTNREAYNLNANWSASVSATNYWFDMTNASGYVGSYSNYLVGPETTLAVTGLQPGVLYDYRLRAENATGVSTSSGWRTERAAASVIALSPATVSYTGTFAGVNPSSQTWSIENSGNCAMNYSNTISYGEGASDWFVCTASGSLLTNTMNTWTGTVDLTGINAGTWYATNTITAPTATNAPQAIVVALTVLKSDQTVSFAPISDQLTTNEFGLAATASSGLTVSFAVDSGPAVIRGATNLSFNATGVVTIVATQAGNTNYNETATTNSFTVTKAVAGLTLNNLSQTYNGSQRVVTGSTVPTNLTVDVTYDGSSTPPTNAGSYTVIGTVNDIMYQGGTTGTLIVAKADQSITFNGIPSQNSTNTVGLTATASSGGVVSFAVLDGPGHIASATNLTFSTSGVVRVTADQGGDANFNAAPTVTNTITVNKSPQSALIFAPASPQVFMTTNSLTTSGGSGTGAVSYAVADGPGTIVDGNGLYINSGSGVVTVVATKTWDDMFSLTATTSLVSCARAEQHITFPAIPDQKVTNQVALVASASSDLTVSFSILSGPGVLAGGTNLTFNAPGSVLVLANQVGDTNYNAAATVTNTITVDPILAEIDSPTYSNVFETVAELGANIVATNHVAVSERGVFWGTSNTFTLATATRVSETGLFGNGAYSLTVTNLVSGSTNFFRGFVVNSAGTNMTTVSEFLTRPAAPQPLVATNRESYSFHANWTAAVGATNYWFDMTNSGGYVGIYSNLSVGNQTTLAVTGLQPGVTYSYRLRAENATGISTNSGWLDQMSAAGVIGLAPVTMSYTGTYVGTNPADQLWTISNEGNCAFTYTNHITYGNGASDWFTAPASGTLATNTMHTWTGSVDITGINAGIWYATNSFSAPTATNSPQLVLIELTVLKADQSITFDPLADQDITNTIGLAATAESGLTVAFSVASGPGTISSGTNLSFTATGLVHVVASQSGDTNWNPAINVTNVLQVHPVLPRVTTRTNTVTSHTTIESGGNVIDDGGAPITQRGICWSTAPMPSLAETFTQDDTGTGDFASVARGLTSETTYYIRAYAMNEVGTVYGEEFSAFTDVSPPVLIPYTWTGSEDTAWTNANNWITGVPTAADTAVFTAVGAAHGMVSLDGDRYAGGFVVNTNADGPVMLANGNLFITNRYASVEINHAAVMLYGALTLGPDALITNAPESGLFGMSGTHTHGHLDLYAGDLFVFGISNTFADDVVFRSGNAYALADLSFTSTGRFSTCADSVFMPFADYADMYDAIRITNETPGSVAAEINGKLLIEMRSGTNGCETIDVGHNALILGTNSVLELESSASTISITSTYTIARYDSLSGTFGEVKGVTAHTVHYGTNAITLEPTFVWSGSHNTNWSEGLNWTNSSGAIPGEQNDAGFIVSTNDVFVNLDTNPVVRSIRALGQGTVTLEGAGRMIVLTNTDVCSGLTPAIQTDDAVLVIDTDIETIPGAQFVAMGQYGTRLLLPRTITCLPGEGSIVFEGNRTIELSGSLNMSSPSNRIEVRGCELLIGSDTNLGMSGNTLLIGDEGELVATNSLTLARPLQLVGRSQLSLGGTSDTLTIGGPISGTGQLKVFGNGTVRLQAPATISALGATQCLLQIVAPLSTEGSIEIMDGARLGGSGPVNIDSSTHQLMIYYGAFCAPGSSIGTLTVNGSMTIEGTLDVEIANASNDVLHVRDTLTISPDAALNLMGAVDGVSDYELATFTSRSGQFIAPTLPPFYTLTQSQTNIVLAARTSTELGATNAVRDGQTIQIDLSISSNTSWTAVSTSSWITVSSGASGTGNGTIILTIAENEDPKRSGTVWIAGMAYDVTQDAAKAVYLDFDGDSLADVTVYWPERGYWYILRSSSLTGCIQPWGWDDAEPVPGDYDGDGLYDAAVYYDEDGAWYIMRGCKQFGYVLNWGFADTIPVPADYDDDGITDLGVFDPATYTWYIYESSAQNERIQTWGFAGCLPVRGDFDGDAKDDIAMYHPEDGMWYILLSSSQTLRVQAWGWDGAKAVPGDYDGDGTTDLAVYEPMIGCWSILQSSDNQARVVCWGWNAAYPVPADYDGDEKWDLTDYWPEGGQWYIWQSQTQDSRIQPWGCDKYYPVNGL